MINNIHRTLYSNEQGNFGIDHTNPTHLLTIGNTETVTVPILITSKADAQIHLVSPDTWTGIKFNDAATGEDFLWHHGENGGVFSMGGGGAFGTNRKLHVHGGVTIGEGFQGETTIDTSNSLFVQNRVGIGTTTPAEALHVHNNSSGSSRIRLQNTEGAWDWAVDQQDMYFATGSSIPFYINSSGNVGVGTTSPTANLDINNDKSPVDLQLTETSTAYHKLGIRKEGSKLKLVEFNNDGTSVVENLLTADASSGNVGIGTTSPNRGEYGSTNPRLHVQKTGSNGTYDLVARFQAGNDADNTGAAILINHANDRGLLIEAGRQIQDASIAHLRLLQSSAGTTKGITLLKPAATDKVNVGIGVEAPATTLEVAGNVRINGGTDYGSQLIQWCDNNGHAGIAAYDLMINNGQNGNRTTTMFFSSTGNVGIGTTSPSGKVQVVGTSDGYDTLRLSSPAATALGDITSGIVFSKQDGFYDGYRIYGVNRNTGNGSADLYFDRYATTTTHTTTMVLKDTGRVGIGTTNPQSPLTVAHQESRFGIESAAGDTWNSTDPTRMVFQDHGNFWIGAGNGTWFTGTPNTKSMASGLAADATYAHDLLLTTMYSTSTYDRGITFAVAGSDASYSDTNTTSGWRLGKWHSGISSATSKFAIDGGLIVKGGYTDTYDYYLDDYSAYYTTQGADGAAWGGDSNWVRPSIMAATAIQIQSGNNNVANPNNPALQFHQYGYGGVQMRYHGPGDTLWIEDTSSDGSRMNRVIFASDNRSNTVATAMTLSVTHQCADNLGSGIDLVSGDATGSSRHFSPFIRFYDTSSSSDMASAAVGDLNWSLGVDDTNVSSFRLQYVSGAGGTKANNIRTGSSRLWIDGPTGKVGIGTDAPNYQLEVGTAEAMEGNWSKSLKLSATHPVICFAGGGSKHAFIGYDTASSTEGLSLNVSGTTDDRNSSTLGIKIDNRGYVGVGFNNPSYRLDVNDDSGDYRKPGLRLLGSSPTIKLEDTEHDDFYLHVNSDNFYIMTDKNDDNTHDQPYPLRLENSTSKGYIYSHEIVHAGNAYDYLPRMISTNYFNHIPLPYNCSANATTPRRTRIMRTTIDTNDWSSKGTIMIQLFERYYYGDRMKRYIIDFNPYTTPGGGNTPNARAILVEEIGTGLGSYYDVYCETTTYGADSNGGSIRYCDIWVRCKSYAQVSVVITTNSNLSESTTPASSWSYIWEQSPTLENIADFTAEEETVDQRTVHVNKTMSGPLIARSETENRPLFPGGFVSTDAGGSADVWAPDRINHPSSGTASQRWGIKWDDPNNQLIFMGAGSNRLLIDLDGGSGGLTWEGQKIWNAGNDGSGSGLDADLLDGVHASNFIRKSGLGSGGYYSADAWIEMKDVNAGIYWSGGVGNGWHLYPKNTTDFFVRSGNTNTALQFCGSSETPWGYVYANNSSELGFLNASRSWRILCKMGTNGTSNYNPNIWFKGEQGSAWSGDPVSDEAKIEYHSDIMYFAAGSNSNTTNSFIFRRGNTNISYINSSGKYMGDTDKVDGLHASSFLRSDADDSTSGSINFANSYYEFGNSTGSVSNDGSWNARINIAGSSHARIDVKSVSDGIITNMIAHSGHGAGKIGTWSNHPLHLMANATSLATLSTAGSLSTTIQGTLWGTNNDGSGSGLDADTVDGLQASNFLRSGSSSQTIYGGQIHANSWFRSSTGQGLYNSGTDSHFYSPGANYWHINGDSGNQTSGGLVFYNQYNSAQGNATGRKGYVYWDSSGFGLLSNDGSWGVRCTNTTTDLYGTIRQDGTNTVWHAGNDGSGSGLDADLVDGVHGTSFLRSDASDTFTGLLSVGSTTSRRAGMYGIYDSYKTGHIWSMGTSYVISNTGADFGTLYGFAYKHTNNSTGGTMGAGHMAVWCQNGTPYVSLGTNIWCKNNITAYSDARVKDDITTITNAVDKVKSIRGVTYHRTDFDDEIVDNDESNKRHMGVIAQEILDVIPEVVTGGPTEQDPDGHYSVAYGNIVALLIEAVKEQQTQLDKQQQQIEQLKQQLEK